MPARDDASQAERASAARLDAADVFATLEAAAVHREWLPLTMSREFADPGVCPLCRGGWCVQRLVIRPGGVSRVVHGLALH